MGTATGCVGRVCGESQAPVGPKKSRADSGQTDHDLDPTRFAEMCLATGDQRVIAAPDHTEPSGFGRRDRPDVSAAVQQT